MKHLYVTTLVAVTLLATGCNTMKGIGQDISKAGQAMSNIAQNTQEKYSYQQPQYSQQPQYPQQPQYQQPQYQSPYGQQQPYRP
ncbi:MULTISPECIES: entericidin A/B family lipoprotein [unclassified Acinetobacter]|uniref:entericidin A/B family lipoprotein n=1 Tax=unclassified Acinetobacter TaxID=196816 RepID=UPI0035BB4D23